MIILVDALLKCTHSIERVGFVKASKRIIILPPCERADGGIVAARQLLAISHDEPVVLPLSFLLKNVDRRPVPIIVRHVRDRGRVIVSRIADNHIGHVVPRRVPFLEVGIVVDKSPSVFRTGTQCQG